MTAQPFSAPTFTVFTATFNRAHTLDRVFTSLQRQSVRDFEWLVVDDGSTDDTATLMARMAEEADFPVRYIRREENAGKHVVFNVGVREARGTLFLSLDSDDSAIDTALERLLFHWNSIPVEERDGFTGVTVLCQDERGNVVGDPFPRDHYISDYTQRMYDGVGSGEKWGFHRTAVLRDHPFPEIAGTKYITEGLVWCQIAERYKMLYVNEALRIYHDGADQLTGRNYGRVWRGHLPFQEYILRHHLRYLRRKPKLIAKHAANLTRSYLHALSEGQPPKISVGLAGSLVLAACAPIGAAAFVKDKLHAR